MAPKKSKDTAAKTPDGTSDAKTAPTARPTRAKSKKDNAPPDDSISPPVPVSKARRAHATAIAVAPPPTKATDIAGSEASAPGPTVEVAPVIQQSVGRPARAASAVSNHLLMQISANDNMTDDEDEDDSTEESEDETKRFEREIDEVEDDEDSELGDDGGIRGMMGSASGHHGGGAEVPRRGRGRPPSTRGGGRAASSSRTTVSKVVAAVIEGESFDIPFISVRLNNRTGPFPIKLEILDTARSKRTFSDISSDISWIALQDELTRAFNVHHDNLCAQYRLSSDGKSALPIGISNREELAALIKHVRPFCEPKTNKDGSLKKGQKIATVQITNNDGQTNSASGKVSEHLILYSEHEEG